MKGFHYSIFGGQIENFKSCVRVPKHCIWLLRGWAKWLKMILQKQLPKNLCLCLCGDKRPRQTCLGGDSHRTLIGVSGNVFHVKESFDLVTSNVEAKYQWYHLFYTVLITFSIGGFNVNNKRWFLNFGFIFHTLSFMEATSTPILKATKRKHQW